MTYTINHSPLEFKSDISNPVSRSWSGLFGFKKQHNKTNQDKKKRSNEDSQSTNDSCSKWGTEWDEIEKLISLNEDKIPEENLRYLRIRCFALHKYSNTRPKTPSTAKIRSYTNQFVINNIIDELRSTGELEDLIIKYLEKNTRAKSQAISEKEYSSTTNQQLNITKDRIKELANEEDDDEYGRIVIPTQYATEKAIDLISEAAQLCTHSFSKAWVSTEDNGGIYLTWSKPDLDKEFRVLVPASKELKVYLYHEEKEDYGSKNNITAKDLSERINWINS
jgi:hypothetical protein